MRAIRWDESNCDRHCDIVETTLDCLDINQCYTHLVWWYVPDYEEIHDL